jgi:hypothetical protein
LSQLAEPDSIFMSVGCEIGAMRENDRFSAGGYLQLTFADLHGLALDRRNQERLRDGLRLSLHAASGGWNWQVEFTISVVAPEAIGGPDQVWSPVIDFHTFGKTLQEALNSREALIQAICDYLEDPR